MAYKYNEDLFADTTMTFGEHLEELRSSLFKAVVALVLGFVIGLFIGDWVVRRIQDPLVAALQTFYKDRSVLRLKNALAERKLTGQAIPPALRDPKNIDKLVVEDGLLPEEVYAFPGEIVSELRRLKVPAAESLKLPATAAGSVATRDDMLRFFLWR